MGNIAYGMMAGVLCKGYAFIEHLLWKVSLTGLERLSL